MADTEDKTPIVPPFEDVKGQFQFTGFDDDQREVILGQVKQAWDTDSGRAMLQDGLNNNGLHFLNINDQSVIQTYANSNRITPDKVSTGNFARPDLGNVYLNGYDALDANGNVQTYSGLHPTMDGQQAIADTPIRSLDTNGEVFSVPPVYTLIHETNHAARSVPDIPRSRPNGIEYDQTMSNTNSEEAAQAYYGANEVDTQKILSDMGIDQHRGAYNGTAALDDVSLGADYGLGRDHDVGVTTFDGIDMTGHSPVDSVVVGATAVEAKIAAANVGIIFTDAQSRQYVSNEYKLGDGNDTVHAFDGNDIVYSGGGNDGVFLGLGDDVAHAGWGSNTIDGGDAKLDPKSDHLSDHTTDWGVDTVDYTNLNMGLTNSLKYAYDGISPPGIEISINGDDVSVNKGKAHIFDHQDDVDQLNNIDVVKATDRADTTEVENLSSDMLIDGGNGLDTLRIDTLPKGTEVTNVPESGMFHGQPYDGYIQIGTNKLYYNDYENFELPKAESENSKPKVALEEDVDVTFDIKEMPMEEAVTILRDESNEALRLGPDVGRPDAVSPMLNSSAGASVMQTLIDNRQASIPVSPKAMEGNAYQRVGEVLKGSVDRLNEIDKVNEAEMRFEEIENDRTVEPENTVELAAYEADVSHGL